MTTNRHPIFQAAIDADNAFQAELVSVYGKGAIARRFFHPVKLFFSATQFVVDRQFKRVDKRVTATQRESPHVKRNPQFHLRSNWQPRRIRVNRQAPHDGALERRASRAPKRRRLCRHNRAQG